MITVILLALGLSMDAVAVSICTGLARPNEAFSRALRMPLAFGFFQALMPLLGWLGGSALLAYIAAWDHWLAFALLTIIGGKMFWEGWSGDGECKAGDPFAWKRLIILSLATSIDAAAAGLSIAFIGLPVLLSVAIIGVTTTALCLPALRLGGRLGSRWASRADLIGGLTLIGIGIKIVVEHLRA
jgi:putative Mn2+ efflux pump MntP